MILNAIKQMERASRFDPEVISLAQGIPFGRSDRRIREAAIEAIARDKADCYSDPQGLVELRERIATLSQEQGLQYSANETIITAGAIEGLNAALHTFVSKERNEVVMPVPVYSAYGRAVELSGGKVVPIRLNEEKAWSLDVDMVRAGITPKTSAILICNPNNPTGSVYSKQALVELAELAVEHDLILIIDEVYGNMVYTGELFSPGKMRRYRKNIVRLVSFSKDFALTGWRIGFLQADQSHIAEQLAVHDTLINCAPVVSQYAAIAALKNADRILRANEAAHRRHRRIMTECLDELKPRISYVMPQGAYFVFVKIAGVTDSLAFCMELLKAQKLAVVPGEDFGPGGEGHVRLCFGRSAGAIHEGMARFTTFVRSAQKKV